MSVASLSDNEHSQLLELLQERDMDMNLLSETIVNIYPADGQRLHSHNTTMYYYSQTNTSLVF